MSLEQIFAKVGEEAILESIGYVFEAPIHYIVLNTKDNSWNMTKIERYIAILD